MYQTALSRRARSVKWERGNICILSVDLRGGCLTPGLANARLRLFSHSTVSGYKEEANVTALCVLPRGFDVELYLYFSPFYWSQETKGTKGYAK